MRYYSILKIFSIILVITSQLVSQVPNKDVGTRNANTRFISMTKCKNRFMNEIDTIEYYWDLKTLTIIHKNSNNNCGSIDFSITANISNNFINIHENAILDGVMGCNCNYDLIYKIEKINPQIYHFHIDDFRENLGVAPALVFSIDLRYPNKGSIVFDRFYQAPVFPTPRQ